MSTGRPLTRFPFSVSEVPLYSPMIRSGPIEGGRVNAFRSATMCDSTPTPQEYTYSIGEFSRWM